MPPMKLHIDVIDTFTDKQFRGNSAAVVILKHWISETLMQSIAIENNLSETAFLVLETANDGIDETYAIRWFSPITEIDFCGHATLAAAFVIFNQQPQINQVNFTAKAVGTVTVSKTENGYLEMNFPNRMPSKPDFVPSALLDGLSIAPSEVLLNNQAYFAIYENEDDVVSVEQNADELRKLAPYDVVVTAPGKKFDFVSRYFWPANGGDEDPVTGSIYTGLAPYWSKQLGKLALVAYQASKRGGVLKCNIIGNRVHVSGQAVHYLSGEITLR